jgi:hypothetical protein
MTMTYATINDEHIGPEEDGDEEIAVHEQPHATESRSAPRLPGEPDWSKRPWGKPSVSMVSNTAANPNLLGVCTFQYHHMRIRGARVYQGQERIVVRMPAKTFGMSLESVCYFTDKEEREQFESDVAWCYRTYCAARRAALDAQRMGQARVDHSIASGQPPVNAPQPGYATTA